MQEHPPSAKELVQTLWSELVLNAQQNPTKEYFDEVERFAARHKVFFKAGVIEAFPYEELFAQHFPTRYNEIKTTGVVVNNWREKFLETCEEAYKEKNSELFIAIKSKNLEKIKLMIKEGKISDEVLNVYDDVEKLSLGEFAVKYDFQRACDELYNAVAPPLRDREEDAVTLLRKALYLHQPLDEIRRCCKNVNLKEEMPHSNDLWITSYACGCGYFDAAELFVREMGVPVDSRTLDEVSIFGHLKTLKYFLSQAPAEVRDGMYPVMIETACTAGHLELLRYFIDELKKVLSDTDTIKLLRTASLAGQLPVVKYLLEGKKVVSVPAAIFAACEGGHLDVLDYWLKKLSLIPGKYFDELLKKALAGYFGDHRSGFDLATFKFLLEKGADPLLMFGGHGSNKEVELIRKITDVCYPNERLPSFVRKIAERLMRKYGGDKAKHLTEIFLAALDNPTRENVEKLASDESFKALLLSNGYFAFIYERLFTPFFKPVVKPKTEIEHHSGIEKIIDGFVKDMRPITRKNIDAVSPEDCLAWEWAELLREAGRYPTEENWNKVQGFKAKYEQYFPLTCQEFYQASQLFLNATFTNVIPDDQKVDMVRNLDTRTVGDMSATNKGMFQFFEDFGEWRRRFKMVFPSEYEVLIEKTTAINWRNEFVSTIKKLKLTADQLALLMAAADKDIQAFSALVAKLPRQEYYNLWGITLLKCASLNNFKEGVDQLWSVISGSLDVNTRFNVNKLIVLAICARRPLAEIVGYIDLRANIHWHSEMAWRVSPFLLACECNYVECAQVLLNRTAPWHSTDLIEAAAAQGNFRAVKLLVGTTGVSRESLGQAAFKAYANGYESIAEYLLDNGAETDAFLKMMADQIKEANIIQGNGSRLFDAKERSDAFYYMKLALDYPTERNINALSKWEHILSSDSKMYPACKFLLKRNSEFFEICRSGRPQQIRDLILYKNRDIFLLNDATQKTVLEKLVVLKDLPLVEKILEAYIKDNSLYKSSIEFLWASALLKGIREPSAENNQRLDTLRSIKQYQNMFVLRLCPELYELCKPFLAPPEPERKLSPRK